MSICVICGELIHNRKEMNSLMQSKYEQKNPCTLGVEISSLVFYLCFVFYPLSATNPQKKEMKELNVKKVSLANVAVENVLPLLDKEKVDFQSINTVNWKAFLINRKYNSALPIQMKGFNSL